MIKKYLKFFLFACICFIISDIFVNADIIQYQFMGYASGTSPLKQTSFTPDETYTYNRDYVLFNGTERFFAFNYCATGPFDFGFPVDIEGVTAWVGYSTGGHCYVQGYNGYNYTMYFMAKQVNDAGNGNSSIMFNTRMHNTNSYNVYINFLSLDPVSSIPAGIQIPTYDGEFTTLNTKIDSVDQAVVELQQAQNQMISEQQNTTNAVNDVNNTLNDDNTSGATDEASDFFSSFSTETFGLTSIITAPLNLIQSLTSSTCSPLHIPLPFLDNKYIDLPCMTSIYQSTFGAFFTMYQTITFGIIAYWVCVRVFNQVKDFKNPEHDEIEVLDL